MGTWFESGCAKCRQGILSADRHEPSTVGVSIPAHAELRRCETCGAWWEVNEREAHVISADEAHRTFPGLFAGNVSECSAD